MCFLEKLLSFLAGLLEEEASLVTAGAAAHLPLDEGRTPKYLAGKTIYLLKIYDCLPVLMAYCELKL
jgi:hypothetical protein